MTIELPSLLEKLDLITTLSKSDNESNRMIRLLIEYDEMLMAMNNATESEAHPI